jgi:hypothetical protein
LSVKIPRFKVGFLVQKVDRIRMTAGNQEPAEFLGTKNLEEAPNERPSELSEGISLRVHILACSADRLR